MKTSRTIALSIVVLGGAALFTTAQAQPAKIRGADSYEIAFAAEAGKPDKDKSEKSHDEHGAANENSRSEYRGDPRDDARRDGDRRDVRFGGDERDIARRYYNKKCPRGLAKKNNGCLPPGIAKKRYEIGRPLPDGWYGDTLPEDLSRRLPRLPVGYDYRLLDGDLGIIDVATLTVMDAIGLR